MKILVNLLKLDNELVNTSGEINVQTPFDIEFSDIRNVLIEQTPTITKKLSIYPNGCFVYVEQSSTSLKMRSNYKFQEDGDGSYTLIAP